MSDLVKVALPDDSQEAPAGKTVLDFVKTAIGACFPGHAAPAAAEDAAVAVETSGGPCGSRALKAEWVRQRAQPA
jgi:hypothetical protein